MEIIQIPLTDQLSPVLNMRIRTFFVLDDHLNEGALRDALDRLIRYHWRKLGGRIAARPSDGRLEFRVPLIFDDEYELFKWSSTAYKHSVAQVLPFFLTPPSSNGVALLPSFTYTASTLHPADWSLQRKDDPADCPPLFIHLSCFSDATVLAISMSHVVGDQMGLSNIMKAWLGLTIGLEPPGMLGYHHDALPQKSYNDYSTDETYRQGRIRVRRPLEYPLVVSRFIPELVLHPTEERHIIFFPHVLIKSLRERYAEELKNRYGVDSNIGDGDVITAITTKFAYMHNVSPVTVTVQQTVNLRGRIPELPETSKEVFIQNSMNYASVRVKVGASTPTSEIAYRNREAVTEALDPKDIGITLAVIREMVKRGQPILTCEPFDVAYNVTNWTRAWRDLDFSGALRANSLRQGKELKLLVLGASGEPKSPARFTAMITGRTNEGYYCNFAKSTKEMKALQKYLDEDPLLEKL